MYSLEWENCCCFQVLLQWILIGNHSTQVWLVGWGTIPGISFANWNSSVQKRCTLSGYVTEIQYIKWDLYVVLLYFVIPLLQWSWKGVYWFHLCRSLCQSIYLNPCGFVHTKICPFWTKSCLLCFFHNTCWVNFIFIHLIKQLQKACHVLSSFFSKFQKSDPDFVLCPCTVNVEIDFPSEFLS